MSTTQSLSLTPYGLAAPHSRELGRILCIREERTVRNDFTVIHGSRLYQIEKLTRARKVVLETRLDGTLHITHNGQDLAFREITAVRVKKTPRPIPVKPARQPWNPPTNHPWRRTFLTKQRIKERMAALP